MKFTTILAAALAAVSSTAASALPAKFTLKFTTAGGTALDQYPTQVTRDKFYGQFVNIGPGSNQVQDPITLFTDAQSTAYVTNIDGLGNWYLTIIYDGTLLLSGHDGYYNIPTTGFLQVGSTLAVDLGDGKGPQALWSACPSQYFRQLWEIYWNPASTLQGCIPIGLTVVAL